MQENTDIGITTTTPVPGPELDVGHQAKTEVMPKKTDLDQPSTMGAGCPTGRGGGLSISAMSAEDDILIMGGGYIEMAKSVLSDLIHRRCDGLLAT